jgi:hypothetical protein
MTIKFSTGLRNNLAGSTGFAGTFANGVIEIYTGPQPLSADNPPTGTLLGYVTTDGLPFAAGSPTNGLTFDAPASGTVSKAAAATWKTTGIAQGTAGWFRLKGNAADAGAQSTTAVRMDGSIGTSGADLNMSNIAFDVGVPSTIDVFQFTVPAQ